MQKVHTVATNKAVETGASPFRVARFDIAVSWGETSGFQILPPCGNAIRADDENPDNSHCLTESLIFPLTRFHDEVSCLSLRQLLD